MMRGVVNEMTWSISIGWEKGMKRKDEMGSQEECGMLSRHGADI
jgi:hypothetical protein